MFPVLPVTNRVVACLSLMLVAFVGYKSSVTSFTHDESLTYYRFVHQSFLEIVSYSDPFTNNHILNTLMMKWFECMFGASEFTLRLHCLLSLVAYLFASRKLMELMPGKLQLPFFLLMTTNPYLIDFFGLARGYGLCAGAVVLSFYYAVHWLRGKHLSALIAFNFFAFLAAYSNFSAINYYLAAVFSLNIVLLLPVLNPGNQSRTIGKQILVANTVNAISLFISALVFWEPVRKILLLHMIDFGGKSGFVSDTVSSVVLATFYNIKVSPGLVLAISWAVTAAVVALVAVMIYRIGRNLSDHSRHGSSVFAVATLTGIAMISIIEHRVFNSDFLIGRFAIFLYPLFILSIVLVAGNLFTLQNGSRAIAGCFTILAAVFVLNFGVNVNMVSYLDWAYDSDTRNMMSVLEAHHAKTRSGVKVRLGTIWYCEPAINFYRIVRKLDWLQQADRSQLGANDNYFFSSPSEIQPFNVQKRDILFISRPGWILAFNRGGARLNE